MDKRKSFSVLFCGECVPGRLHITHERFYPGNLLFWPIPWNPRPASSAAPETLVADASLATSLCVPRLPSVSAKRFPADKTSKVSPRPTCVPSASARNRSARDPVPRLTGHAGRSEAVRRSSARRQIIPARPRHPRPLRRSRRFTVIALLHSASRRYRVPDGLFAPRCAVRCPLRRTFHWPLPSSISPCLLRAGKGGGASRAVFLGGEAQLVTL